MITIRPAKKEDLREIQLINQLNSSHPDKPQNEKEFCLYLYSGYYMKFETENCFVAVNDDNDEIAGYILAVADCEDYLSQIENDYHSEAIKLGFEQRFLEEIHTYEKYRAEYPAHFHIDVRPGYQRKGIGSMLLDAEIANLKDRGVRGLMLSVGKNKRSGNRFYEKNGFPIIDENEDSYIRGKKL